MRPADTPASEAMRLAEAPSCPYLRRHASVASIKASRRTVGGARRNLGACGLAILEFPSVLTRPEPLLYSCQIVTDHILRHEPSCPARRPGESPLPDAEL